MPPLPAHLDRPYRLIWCQDVRSTFRDLCSLLQWDDAKLHPSNRYAELEADGALLALAAVDIADKADARDPSRRGPCAGVTDLDAALRTAQEAGFQPLNRSQSGVVLQGPAGSVVTLVPEGRPCQP